MTSCDRQTPTLLPSENTTEGAPLIGAIRDPSPSNPPSSPTRSPDALNRWLWLHKMRRAMVRPGRERLSGYIEVDETLIGGESHGGKRGRGSEKKSLVAIALEIHEPKGFGRVRMQQISDASGANLIPFICETVKPGSVVLTDSWGGYNELEERGYVHKKVNLSSSGDPAHVLLPGTHRIASLLKRWLLGTHQGAVNGKHLNYYLDEYTFRFNRRSSKARGLLFYRLMQQAVDMQPVSYKELVHGRKRDAKTPQSSLQRSG